SGAIALALAVECPRARVVATDVSSDALAVARANVAGVGRAGTRVTVYEGDWFSALPDELRGTVDVVVANPPYVADEEDLPAVVTD
ncbi:MAG: methyltransferase, partial [Actinobacteria bacterium]|nr:methyltransferase [Actinomycetota bacterium]NIS30959.1 methyltransferase [Actinomycetota bacterium]NIT95394.1 methyltransferase [Actinomycetota bacterium]NIU19081.1 methyltransferase [Actinomycetota bacterium]NIU66139.1 methyltransferase [Actinomycetota bacterium]